LAGRARLPDSGVIELTDVTLSGMETAVVGQLHSTLIREGEAPAEP